MRRQVRAAIAKRLAWQAAAAVGLAGWAWLILDRLLEPGPALRAGALALLVGWALAWLGAVAAYRLFGRLTDRQLLTLAHRHRPRDADLVATGLDLLESPSQRAAPKLQAATIRSAEAAADRLAEVRLVRPAGQSLFVGFALVTVLSAAGLVAVRPDLAGCFARRVALSDEPWPRRVRLVAEGFERHAPSGEWRRHTPRGEPAEFFVTASVDEGEDPPALLWAKRLARRGSLFSLTRVPTGPSGDTHRSRFRQRLERVDQDQVYAISGGDARLRLRLVAADRPQLTDLQLIAEPPAYLGGPPVRATSATLGALPEGSRVRLAAGASKPLASAHAQLASEGRPPSAAAVELADGGVALRVEAGELTERAELVIEGVGADGIALSPVRLELEVAKDEPPGVSLTLDGVGGAITRDALVGLVATVDDDHGLDWLAVELTSGEQTLRVDAATPATAAAKQPVEIDLLSLRSADPERRLSLAPGDRLRVEALAADRYDLGPRDPSRSAPITLEVVTESELLARIGDSQRELRTSLGAVLADVERVAYEADLRRRRLATPEEADDAPALEDAGRWASQRQLDLRKAAASVAAAAGRADGLRRQVVNNRLDQAALVDRLSSEIVAPLRRVAEDDLPEAERIAADATSVASLAAVVDSAQRAAETIRRVASALDSQQTYNEVVALLRDLIRDQRRVNQRTTQAQSQQARSLLLD